MLDLLAVAVAVVCIPIPQEASMLGLRLVMVLGDLLPCCRAAGVAELAVLDVLAWPGRSGGVVPAYQVANTSDPGAAAGVGQRALLAPGDGAA